ncbi:MAG: universal stress protein [Gammaproteobacteria bacterium]|nr:universal stress protein [Gammaproteobacteria bacterium]MBU1722576.1 universal stress protein [Gammaproteobacteria bacterium]MBU2007048.1 universal stress protein [Gammaproteobacteria bacterium]
MNDVKPFKTILYATNLGEHMRPVFRQAIHMARTHQAKIIMLHAVAPMGTTGHTVLSLYLPDKPVHDIEQESMEEVIQTMKKRLENYCAEEDDICKAKDELVEDIVVAPGKPGDVIVHYADAHNADLIVIGSHTRMGGDGLLGSAARYVTQHSKVPVLVVPNR